jgi:hypothetical protein
VHFSDFEPDLFSAAHANLNSDDGVMFAFKFAMIQSEPAITKITMSTPNASASTLLVLSGPEVSAGRTPDEFLSG